MHDTEDIGAAIRAAASGVRAPASLRERVEAGRARGGGARRRRGRLLGGGLAAGLAAAAVVLVLVLSGGGAPTVADAAAVALSPPSGPAPGEVPGAPLLRARIGELAFPYWDDRFGWRAVGQRTARVHGRETRTVFYADAAGRRLGYTIVGGPGLDVPAGARQVRHGTTVTLLRRDGARIATWRRDGHTCVLAGRGVPDRQLVALATWDAGGSVRGY